MPGESHLPTLLRTMRPVLREGEFVYCLAPPGLDPSTLAPVCGFREEEGLTLILPSGAADGAGIAYEGAWRMITLTVHSSLAAVGFLAAVTARLAAEGISVNPVAAFHHDHLFVPADRAGDALRALQALAEDASPA